jgi:glycine cleavage system regulatory protein
MLITKQYEAQKVKGCADSATPIAPMREVDRQLAHMNDAIGALTSTAERLSSRLQPIVSMAPADADAKPEVPTGCKLALALDDFEGRIRRVTELLSSLESSVQI